MRPEARDVREDNELFVIGRLERRKAVVLECISSLTIPVGRRRSPLVSNGFGSCVGIGDLGNPIDEHLDGSRPEGKRMTVPENDV